MSYEKLSEVDDEHGTLVSDSGRNADDMSSETGASFNLILWDPKDNITLLLIPDDPGFKGPCRIDHQILLQVRDSCTAEMILKAPLSNSPANVPPGVDDNGVSYIGSSSDSASRVISSDKPLGGGSDRIVLVLDLMAKVVRIRMEGEEKEELTTGLPPVVSYLYSRLNTRLRFDIVPLCDSKTKDDDSRALDFIFKQYTLYSVSKGHTIFDAFNMCDSDIGGVSAQELREIEEKEKPNAVARSFETSGQVLRLALKASGAHTGTAIRFLGQQYTNTALYFNARRNSASQSSSSNGADITDSQSQPDAPSNGDAGEVSDCAGSIADKDAAADREAKLQRAVEKSLRRKAQGESVHAASRTLTSAVLYPVRKIGSAASSFASTKEKEKTATQRVLLDTMGGIGNGFASICKGLTEGLNEIGAAISDVALDHSKKIHGEEYANSVTQNYVDAYGQVGLGIYKVGSVASFGIAGIGIDAVVEGTTYAVSLYEYLVGPVLLQGYMSVVILPFTTPKRLFVVLRPWSIAFYKDAGDFTKKPYKIVANCMLDTIPLVRTRARANNDDDDGGAFTRDEGVGYATGQAPEENKTYYIHRLKGGSLTHIELTTVDCSTYLLYPQESLFQQWLEQLKLACLRVETIQKRQSGAFELAVTRRLRLLPKTNIISISVKCVVLSSIWSTVAKQQSVSDVAALDSEDIDYMLLGDSSLHVNGEEEGIELKTFGGPWDAADEEGAAAFPGSNSESSILRLECDARVESLEEASGARELSGSTLGHELMEPSRQADLSNNTAGALVNRNSLQQDSSSFLSGVNKVLKRQFTISNIMQPIKVSVLREAKVELVPITRSGVKVLDEKCVSNTALFHGHLLEDYLQASEDRFARQLPLPSHAQIDQHALNSSKLLTANWQECNFEMGSKCSLSVSECESIQMRLVAETALNKKNIELGRVEFKLESMSAAACVYTWVDLYTTRSGKIVGKALVSLVQDGN